jgi:hypothetical protein
MAQYSQDNRFQVETYLRDSIMQSEDEDVITMLKKQSERKRNEKLTELKMETSLDDETASTVSDATRVLEQDKPIVVEYKKQTSTENIDIEIPTKSKQFYTPLAHDTRILVRDSIYRESICTSDEEDILSLLKHKTNDREDNLKKFLVTAGDIHEDSLMKLKDEVEEESSDKNDLVNQPSQVQDAKTNEIKIKEITADMNSKSDAKIFNEDAIQNRSFMRDSFYSSDDGGDVLSRFKASGTIKISESAQHTSKTHEKNNEFREIETSPVIDLSNLNQMQIKSNLIPAKTDGIQLTAPQVDISDFQSVSSQPVNPFDTRFDLRLGTNRDSAYGMTSDSMTSDEEDVVAYLMKCKQRENNVAKVTKFDRPIVDSTLKTKVKNNDADFKKTQKTNLKTPFTLSPLHSEYKAGFQISTYAKDTTTDASDITDSETDAEDLLEKLREKIMIEQEMMQKKKLLADQKHEETKISHDGKPGLEEPDLKEKIEEIEQSNVPKYPLDENKVPETSTFQAVQVTIREKRTRRESQRVNSSSSTSSTDSSDHFNILNALKTNKPFQFSSGSEYDITDLIDSGKSPNDTLEDTTEAGEDIITPMENNDLECKPAQTSFINSKQFSPLSPRKPTQNTLMNPSLRATLESTLKAPKRMEDDGKVCLASYTTDESDMSDIDYRASVCSTSDGELLWVTMNKQKALRDMELINATLSVKMDEVDGIVKPTKKSPRQSIEDSEKPVKTPRRYTPKRPLKSPVKIEDMSNQGRNVFTFNEDSKSSNSSEEALWVARKKDAKKGHSKLDTVNIIALQDKELSKSQETLKDGKPNTAMEENKSTEVISDSHMNEIPSNGKKIEQK